MFTNGREMKHFPLGNGDYPYKWFEQISSDDAITLDWKSSKKVGDLMNVDILTLFSLIYIYCLTSQHPIT